MLKSDLRKKKNRDKKIGFLYPLWFKICMIVLRACDNLYLSCMSLDDQDSTIGFTLEGASYYALDLDYIENQFPQKSLGLGEQEVGSKSYMKVSTNERSQSYSFHD